MSITQPDPDDMLDEDIVDIFVEEAAEVVEEINTHFPQWSEDPGDKGSLLEIRRAFHTLKGSGRMVKAADVSELAWAMESLLNRVVDGTLPLTDTVFDLIDNVSEAIPVLVEAFKNRQSSSVAGVDVDLLVKQANALERGKTFVSRKLSDADITPPTLTLNDEFLDEIPAHDSLLVDGLNSRIKHLSDNLERLAEQVDKLGDETSNLKADLSATAGDSELKEISSRLTATQKEMQELKYFLKAGSEKEAADIRSLEQRMESRIGNTSQKIQQMRENLEQDVQRALTDLEQARGSIIRRAVGAALICSLISGIVIYLMV